MLVGLLGCANIELELDADLVCREFRRAGSGGKDIEFTFFFLKKPATLSHHWLHLSRTITHPAAASICSVFATCRC